jgi:hypothetical protein
MEEQKGKLNEKECIGNAPVETSSSISTQKGLIASTVESMQRPADKRITPEEALSRVMEGEELLWSCCPNCNSTLAVYIRTSKVHVAVGPIVPVRPELSSTDDR